MLLAASTKQYFPLKIAPSSTTFLSACFKDDRGRGWLMMAITMRLHSGLHIAETHLRLVGVDLRTDLTTENLRTWLLIWSHTNQSQITLIRQRGALWRNSGLRGWWGSSDERINSKPENLLKVEEGGKKKRLDLERLQRQWWELGGYF